MSNWFINVNIPAVNATVVYDNDDVPVFLNKTGHRVKVNTAFIAGQIPANPTNYYMLYLKDSAGNNMFTKDMYSVALTTSAVSMGSVDTAYQVIEEDGTIYLNFTKAGSGETMRNFCLRLDGELLRGG